MSADGRVGTHCLQTDRGAHASFFKNSNGDPVPGDKQNVRLSYEPPPNRVVVKTLGAITVNPYVVFSYLITK
jgi:hypothetical protein